MRRVLQRCDAINAKISFLEKKPFNQSGTLKQHTKSLVGTLFFFNDAISPLIKMFYMSRNE